MTTSTCPLTASAALEFLRAYHRRSASDLASPITRDQADYGAELVAALEDFINYHEHKEDTK